jgi:transposase InsO family protein
LKLIAPGSPTQNAYVESFNGKFRDECLNDHWFECQRRRNSRRYTGIAARRAPRHSTSANLSTWTLLRRGWHYNGGQVNTTLKVDLFRFTCTSAGLIVRRGR